MFADREPLFHHPLFLRHDEGTTLPPQVVTSLKPLFLYFVDRALLPLIHSQFQWHFHVGLLTNCLAIGGRRYEKWSNKGLQQMIVKQMQKQKMIIGFLKRSQSTLEGAPWIAPSTEPTEPTCSDDLITTTDLVSLTQQQYQQFIDRISGLDARMATLQTHAEALHDQIRVAEIVIQQLLTNPTHPPPPSRAAFSETSD